MKAAIYVRCSTAGRRKYGAVPLPLRNADVQVRPLLDLIERRGWKLHRAYYEQMSGDKQALPAFQALMGDARRGEFKVVVVSRFDRLASGVKQLVRTLDELFSLGIDFVSQLDRFDTTAPIGRTMLTTIAEIAERERAFRKGKVMAGLERARAHGTKSGRRIGRPKCVVDREQLFRLWAQGWSYRRIAEALGIGLGTVTRTLREKGIA